MADGVCIIGLGRIGLPVGLMMASHGMSVIGVDTNNKLLSELERDQVSIYEPGLADLLRSCRSRFRTTTELPEGVRESDVIVFCVGTRRFGTDKPNLTLLHKIFKQLSQVSLKDKLIVLATTVPVGTTRKLARSLEKTTRLVVGKEFQMAFSPVRTTEGNAVRELQSLPVIIGGVDNRSSKRAVDFYRSTGAEVINAGCSEAAELLKLIDNAYRMTQFAFSNDISLIAESLALNAYELIDAANYKYPRNNIPYPTCGVSGYCLSKDPYYLEEVFHPIARKRRLGSLWILGRKACNMRTQQVVNQVVRELRRRGRQNGGEVLVCGIAFKANIDDIRDSHGMTIANSLVKKGLQVSVWDPWIRNRAIDFTLHSDPETAFKGKDAAIFTVAHKEFQDAALKIQTLTGLMRTPLIYDGAGIFRRLKETKLTFQLVGIGLPK